MTTSYFTNKVVAITGGTDGIGKALIGSLLPLGAKIATCGRSHDKIYNLQTAHPGVMIHAVVADVSIEQDCKMFIETTIKALGNIDILINNAGISMHGLVADTDLEVFRKVMDINFFGALYCTRFALPSLKLTKGTIVGVSSIAGYRGLPGRSGYSASKFALQGWLEALRTELLPDKVNVMWVCPGFTASNIRSAALTEHGGQQGQSPIDEGKIMPASECAEIILKAIEKQKRTVVMTFTGIRTVFMNKFFPALSDKMVYNFFFRNGKLIK